MGGSRTSSVESRRSFHLGSLLFLIETVFVPWTLAQQNAASVVVSPSYAAPGGSSQFISPSFAGVGIESSNLFSFTGGRRSTNQLSVNLLSNLANYTGVPPHIRIGGNTGDNTLYDPDFDGWYVEGNPNPTGQGNVATDTFIVGPNYLRALDRFPTGTPITFALNLAYTGPDYLSRIVTHANATRSMLQQTVLASFEIGNEVNLYDQNGFRQGIWNSTVYAQEWLERANAVYEQVLKPSNISANFFEAACTSSTIGNSFAIDPLSQTGILTPSTGASGNKSFVATWNQHDYYYYINISEYTLTLQDFMDLSTTPIQFTAWAEQVREAQNTGLPYALREMASVGPVGQAGISDVFGATLWTLNLFLYVASINVSSVQLHMTDNSFASPWLPIPMYGLQPFVRTTYYAWAAMAQIIGGGCTTQVAALALDSAPSDYANNIRAYASYRSGVLSSVIFINSRISNISNTEKASITITVRLPTSLSGQTLYLSFLSAAGTNARSNTTWNGISYEQSPSGTPTNVSDGYPSVAQIDSSGVATIQLRDAQAVVAALQDRIGTGPGAQYNETACRILGSERAQPRPDTTTNGAQPRPSAAVQIRPGLRVAVAMGLVCMLLLGLY